jgi:diguanylate cyclase (GGDEF)-like protein
MQMKAQMEDYLRQIKDRFGESGLATALTSGRLMPLIDLSLLITAALMLTTEYTVVCFHIIFVLLAFGAFFWKFRGFALRVLFWVGLTTIVVLLAVRSGETQSEELIEIPLLSLILVMVFLIASRRAKALSELEKEHSVLTSVLDERNALQEALMHKAFYDGLTDLPNRALFFDRLQQALTHAARHHESVVVLFIDLDNFKSVNDRYGHAGGDLLLVKVANRIQEQVRAEDTVARLGGDEFTVLLVAQTSMSYAVSVAERIMHNLFLPYLINGREVAVTASIGIAQSRPGHDQPDNLLRDADDAMYKAKEKGKARFEAYDPNEQLDASDLS